ncbi:MAG: hypothetical protein V7K77_27565 [Nostoc sp.]|uniref:hypothetical protein n=1 Tax=Nostoc sp. TaxID=1180 RepID=UPI002FF8CDDC
MLNVLNNKINSCFPPILDELTQKALVIKCHWWFNCCCFNVSLGVASVITVIVIEPATLVNAVEEALYQAKIKGRDRVVV